ncbi:MAG: hypothetical protein CTY31_06865, partial [Hyphomicrobium sp.]
QLHNRWKFEFIHGDALGWVYPVPGPRLAWQATRCIIMKSDDVRTKQEAQQAIEIVSAWARGQYYRYDAGDAPTALCATSRNE